MRAVGRRKQQERDGPGGTAPCSRHCLLLTQVSKPAAVGGPLQLHILLPLSFREKRDSLHTFLLHFSYCLLSRKMYPASAGQALPFQLSHFCCFRKLCPVGFAQSFRAVCSLLTCFTVENSSTSVTYRKQMNISSKWSG